MTPNKTAAWKATGRALGYAWVLGVALIVSATTTDRRARQVEEYASHCDPFGYLQIAQDTRQAVTAYQSTSRVGNTDPPTIKSIGANFHFYFDRGKPSQFNWALLAIAIATIGLDGPRKTTG